MLGTAPDAPSDAPSWSRDYETDLYSAELTNHGGALRRWDLNKYTEPTPLGDIPVALVRGIEEIPVLATPFSELGIGDLTRVHYEVESESQLGATFAVRQRGITIRKSYNFSPNSYELELIIEVENDSDLPISPRFEVLWPAQKRSGSDFSEQALAALHEGSVEREMIASLGSPGFLGSLRGQRSNEVTVLRGQIEWAGIDNKYFLAALLPDRVRDARVAFEPIKKAELGALSLSFTPVELPPGQAIQHTFRAFIGPKLPARLDAVSSTLELSVGRGWSWVTPLTRFFEWMLKACYSVVPNYGVAIIILTLLVRLITMPIMGRQMRSMERMRAIQPKLKELQKQHGDDRQKQSEAMMKLYKAEGVNPLGGCLPMLLQFPVFIGLFYALRSAIELRQANFGLWITDLSAPEALFDIPGIGIPFRVLPLVMGVSMIAQQKLTPTTVDPAQARMMATIMPIMFTVMFYQFPSGLVLYWMISNFLGIGHQLWIGRRMRAAA